MVGFHEFFSDDSQKPYSHEKDYIKDKIIEIIEDLSEEDLYFLLEILQRTVRI